MEPEGMDAAKAVILVVEDEALLRFMLSDELREIGFIVVEAADAEQALRYIAAGGAADLVFSDVQMPGPMDGLQLARLLRQVRPSLPVMLTSGRVDAGTLMEFGTFVPKPYQSEHVIVLMNQLLKRPADESRDRSDRGK